MSSHAARVARHRRIVRVGVTISAAAHAAALAWVAVPGTPLADTPTSTLEPTARPTAELEVVRLAAPRPAETPPEVRATVAPVPAAPAARAVRATTSGVVPSLESLLAHLSEAAPSAQRTDASRPISTFKRLRPVGGSGSTAAVAGAGAAEEEEGDGGLWRELLDGITVTVGAGPYCPVRGGPLIMR